MSGAFGRTKPAVMRADSEWLLQWT